MPPLIPGRLCPRQTEQAAGAEIQASTFELIEVQLTMLEIPDGSEFVFFYSGLCSRRLMNATQRWTDAAVPGRLMPLNWLAAALEWAGDADALGGGSDAARNSG